MVSSDFRRAARQGLRGRWAISVAVTVVATLLGGVALGDGVNNANRANGNEALVSFRFSSGISFHVGDASFGLFPDTWPDAPAILGAFMGYFTTFVLLYGLFTLVVGGAAELGLCNYNVNLVTGREQCPFDTLFGRFYIFGKALLLRLATGLFILLWSTLFIIPGIIAAYRYSMASYVMAQNPDIGVMEALDRSKEIMAGNKIRLFCLDISFIGWMLLSATMTLGIGSIFLRPYMQAARAAFYLEAAAKRDSWGPQY
ncbi:MAG: DUF975 family protein [Oscillospiraceae bacterium]|jgi:uncharacterized membrane protein|nr:DUF975 family protein [Oscillospiraceae bacterium]